MRAAAVQLQQIDDLAMNQVVTISVKVVTVEEPVTVSDKKLLKQDCFVADASGTTRVVLWQGDVGMLHPNASYKIEGLTVRTFQNVNHLSMGEQTTVQEIDDIGEVDDTLSDGECSKAPNNISGEIIAVLSAEEYSSCISCKTKVRPLNEVIGECPKCQTKMKLNRCNSSNIVRAVVEDDGGIQHRVTFF